MISSTVWPFAESLSASITRRPEPVALSVSMTSMRLSGSFSDASRAPRTAESWVMLNFEESTRHTTLSLTSEAASNAWANCSGEGPDVAGGRLSLRSVS